MAIPKRSYQERFLIRPPFLYRKKNPAQLTANAQYFIRDIE